MAYSVSSNDVVLRWRPLSDDEETICNTLIDDAVTLLDTARPALAGAVASGQIADRLVTICIAEAVIRVLINPDLLSNQSVSADGGVSQGFQFASNPPVPRITLSLMDLRSIDRALSTAGLGTGVAGSLRMRNSTPWTRSAAYYGGELDVDDVETSGLSPNASLTDSVTIVVH